MEIIIRDEKIPKNCYECSYLNLCSLNSNFKPAISKCPLKPLSQHDAEVRNKVIDELLEYVKKNRLTTLKIYETYPKIIKSEKDKIYNLTEGRLNILDNFKQKLAELKGE